MENEVTTGKIKKNEKFQFQFQFQDNNNNNTTISLEQYV